MSTFKVSVREHHRRRDGKYPVSIRLTHNRKSASIPTPYYADKSQLTRNFEVKDNLLNRTLCDRIDEYEKLIIGLGRRIELYDVNELKEYLERKTEMNDNRLSFYLFADETIEDMKAEGRLKSAGNYRTAVNNLKKFYPGDLSFAEITSNFLRDYEKRIRTNVKGERAPSLYVGTIKAIFNKACEKYNDEEKGDVAIPHNPFRKYKVPKQNTAKKRGLNSDIIAKILKYNPGHKLDELAKDVFMLSFYMVGMNGVDLYDCPPPEDGYLTYCRTKTKNRRNDKAEISVRLEPEATELYEKYKSDNARYAFAFNRMYSRNDNFNRALNKGLRHIAEALGLSSLQFYAARHSWATIALNECGIPKSDVHEFLNHADQSLKITDYYIQKDWSRLAVANRKVLDLIKSKL